MNQQTTGKSLGVGAVAGALATVPMSWAMELMHQLLPPHERYPLPPRQITERVTKKANLHRHLGQADQMWLSAASHVGYGAAAGAIYAALAPRIPARPIVKGTAWGLLVWTVSYLGLLPALGILTPATRHPARRNLLMILAHLVWGSAIGIFTDMLDDRRPRRHPEFLGTGQPPVPSVLVGEG